MKIKRVRSHRLRADLTPAEAFAYSQTRYNARAATLVDLVTDDGRSGWGEAYGPPTPSRTIIDQLSAPRLIGRDPWTRPSSGKSFTVPFRNHLAREPLKRAGAIIGVPERPGPGLEVDRAVLERYAVTTGETKR